MSCRTLESVEHHKLVTRTSASISVTVTTIYWLKCSVTYEVQRSLQQMQAATTLTNAVAERTWQAFSNERVHVATLPFNNVIRPILTLWSFACNLTTQIVCMQSAQLVGAFDTTKASALQRRKAACEVGQQLKLALTLETEPCRSACRYSKHSPWVRYALPVLHLTYAEL